MQGEGGGTQKGFQKFLLTACLAILRLLSQASLQQALSFFPDPVVFPPSSSCMSLSAGLLVLCLSGLCVELCYKVKIAFFGMGVLIESKGPVPCNDL